MIKAEKKKIKNIKMTLALFSMMIPGMLYLIINNYIPMGGLVIAFKDFKYNLGIWGSEWCGFKNFTFLFKTRDAITIIRNTIGYNLVFIVLGNALAVTVAIMLNFVKGKFSKKVYQTLILIPYLISMVIVSYVVFGFLSTSNGVLNSVIRVITGHSINFYSETKYWPFILTFVYLWKNFGYSSIVYYATIVGIDSSLYEAAAIDGANRWEQVIHIILPGLKTTIITLVLLALGRVFYSDFGLFYQVPMQSGLLTSVTDTIDVYVYKGLTQLNDVGRAAAAGFVQSVLGFILVLTANFVVRKIDKDSALF